MTQTQYGPEDWERTGMIIPVSKETFFNTKWNLKASPLCPYDMLYHPPDYDQKSARSDRKDPKIIRDNIWAQELDKAISSTSHMMLGRPKWKPLDPPDKKHVMVHGSTSTPGLLKCSLKKCKMDDFLSPEDCSCPYQNPGVSVANSPICDGGTLLFMVLLQRFLNGRCDITAPCRRLTGIRRDKLQQSYDYIVVGGGTAGSVVAGRLSENENVTVLLLEAGGDEPVASRVPSFYRNFWHNKAVDWDYRTELGDYCLDQGSKGCSWPRGKMLGGSSVLNGMAYHRGHIADYDKWVAAGAVGWSWEEVEPYFLMSEDNQQIGTTVSPKHHAKGGRMPIKQFKYIPIEAEDLWESLQSAGYPKVNDLNNPDTPEGFGLIQGFHNDSKRVTTAFAYLEPENRRPNLHVLLNSLVSKVLFNGTTAYGVEFLVDGQKDKTMQVRANKEVILCAGALNTPQILMLSGIGPAETLNSLDIPVIADLPVGQNLVNHVGATLYFVLQNKPNVQALDWEVSTEYLLKREGPMAAIGLTQLSGFLYSSMANESAKQPDLQFFFNGDFAECSATGVVGEPVGGGQTQNGYNISLNAVVLRPRSYGNLTIISTDPTDYPIFNPNYFSNPADMVMLQDAVNFMKPVFTDSAFQRKYDVQTDDNYPACNNLTAWSSAWTQCMARYYTDPQNHQAGTAAIGRVVDPSLRVYNVNGLRVMDASAMPIVPSGNPQGVIMMVAERGVKIILDEQS